MEKYFACLLIADATGGDDFVPSKKTAADCPAAVWVFFEGLKIPRGIRRW
jgi:hypothetical protein